jgi:hypothetical protein
MNDINIVRAEARKAARKVNGVEPWVVEATRNGSYHLDYSLERPGRVYPGMVEQLPLGWELAFVCKA